MKEIIRLDNIRRNFSVGSETVHALRGVSFVVTEGEFVTIMGTSGSGKSTLLNTLGCLDTPTAGDYYLDGHSVRTMGRNERATLRNRKIGFVFQNYNLLAKTTAIENVELPLMYNSAYSSARRRQKAIEEGQDIKSTTFLVEFNQQRMMVRDTDKGRELVTQIQDLKKLLVAYRTGFIKEKE